MAGAPSLSEGPKAPQAGAGPLARSPPSASRWPESPGAQRPTGDGPAPGSRAPREVVAPLRNPPNTAAATTHRPRLAPQGGRPSALTRSVRSVVKVTGGGRGRRGPGPRWGGAPAGPAAPMPGGGAPCGAAGRGPGGAQMPWSQSTSRQMYQRIT